MRRRIRMMSIGCMILGLNLLLYPAFSNWYTEIRQGEVIRTYQEGVEQMKEEELLCARQRARAYNERLGWLTRQETNTAMQNLDYEELLNENGDGVMGYIEIPSIDVHLPIYHGTTEQSLSKGAGHLMNTSLPIGGRSTHCVVSAHRGDPSAALFTRLDELQIGDVFSLYVLEETLVYQVDQIKTVLPYETEDFQIVTGEDYVTLVTCTPYGINTHRLLVRGRRVQGKQEQQETEKPKAAEKRNTVEDAWIYAAIATSILIGVAVHCRVKKRKKDTPVS